MFYRLVNKLKNFIKAHKTISYPVLLIVLMSLIAVIILYSGVIKQNEATLPTLTSSPPRFVSSSQAAASSTPEPAKYQLLMNARSENSEAVGWLTVPGTTLDLPIVQHKADTYDTFFYLTHNLNQVYAKTGWPFLDARDDAEVFSKNNVIYGHNMNDGLIFGQLMKYKSLEFLNQNPVIYYGNDKTDAYWKIFACFITDTNLNYIQTDFATDTQYASFIDQIKAQSLFNTQVDVTPQDKILTLSTCTYEFKVDGDNARFAVMARLVRSGESLVTAPAVKNPNPASAHHASSK